jgi:hypothetical protein
MPREINVMGDMQLETGKDNCEQIPFDEEHWVIQAGGEQKQLEWSEKNCEVTADAVKLKELRSYIWELVATKPEYLELPEAVGGYQ